jgi:hypothetical protein
MIDTSGMRRNDHTTCYFAIFILERAQISLGDGYIDLVVQ